MSGVALVACQSFLVGGACVCILMGELDLFSLECNEVFSSEFWSIYGLAWLWAACLLMVRVVFLLCWRISMVCLALELVGSWVGLGFRVSMETFG